jgi:ATP-dependent phosphoenolpyruvate carboxykinase
VLPLPRDSHFFSLFPVLNPRWKDAAGYDAALDKVAHLFTKNFSQYTASETIVQAGPKV